MQLKDVDKLIELIDDDIASLDKSMPREGYDVCLCTLKMMKQYIKALPTVETVPLEDYRSMEQTVYKLTQALAEAEPIKHGRWVIVSDGYGNGVATASICECSLCKDTIWVYKNDKRKWKFCPTCGAKMDEKDTDVPDKNVGKMDEVEE